MSTRFGRLLSLAALALLPGCFTSDLWDWAEDEGWEIDARAEQVEGWDLVDEGYDVRVRYTDGSTSVARVGSATEGSPADLVRRARAYSGMGYTAKAAWFLRLATTRGWHSRDFADDGDFAALRDEPDFAIACAAPVTSPTFVFGPPPWKDPRERQDLWLRGSADRVWLLELEPKTHHEGARGGPLGYVLAVFATPLTVVLDVVTFPAQVVFVVMLGRAMGGAGQH